MDVAFCLAALEDARARFGKPEIFNTDQGRQFTSGELTARLAAAGIRIAMDGRGRWIDNVFIERLWRSLKSEDISLNDDADGREAKVGIAEWLAFYNHRVRTRRWRTGRQWRSGAPVSASNAAQRLWIWRCAWTTLTGCPQPHSRSHSKPLSLEDFRRSERRRFQLTARHQWSRLPGPLHCSPSADQ